MMILKNNDLEVKINLLFYGLMHMVVDGVCAGLIFDIGKRQIVDTDQIFYLIVLYNFLAFGLEPFLGLMVDIWRIPRLSAALGGWLVGLVGLFCYFGNPWWVVGLAGVGNALFHVGGGSISLNLTPKKAMAPGIFVAPGALGLLLGTVWGKSGQFSGEIVAGCLLVMGLMIFLIKKPKINYVKSKIKQNQDKNLFLVIVLIWLAIVIRALVGSVLVWPWKTEMSWLICLTLGIAFGKGIGGIMADKFGWLRVGVGALLLSLPLLIFGGNIPWMAVVGVMLFNMVMPITLVVLANVFPGFSGFSFGLTTLALLVGSFPLFFSVGKFWGSWVMIVIMILSAVVMLYCGLKRYMNEERGLFEY